MAHSSALLNESVHMTAMPQLHRSRFQGEVILSLLTSSVSTRYISKGPFYVPSVIKQ